MEQVGTAGHSSPRKLRGARPTIGLLVSSAAGYDLWPGVADAAWERGGNLACFVGGHLQEPRGSGAHATLIYDLVSAESVDGLIVWASSLANYVSRETIKSFCERYRPLPLVSVGMLLEGIPSVTVDSYGGMHHVVTHLIQVHRRRHIAFVHGVAGHYDAEERYRAYVDALREHGLDLEPELVSPPYHWDQAAGEEAVHLLLEERKVRFDALVAANDAGAFGALRALQARGICVPGDVAVAGFDDAEIGQVVTPPLTTAPLRMYERGREATRILLAMLEGEQVPSHVCLPSGLIVRQSCGCTDPAVLQAVADLDGPTRAGWSEETSTGLVQTLLAAGAAPECGEQLLAVFEAEIADDASEAFLPTLEHALERSCAAGRDLAAWQGAISALRRRMLPRLAGDARRLARAENLCGQARVMIGERAQRARAFRGWQAAQLSERLREIGQMLTTVTSVPELLDVLAGELPQVGIPGCYLSLYEDPQVPTAGSRLRLAYNEQGRLELGATGEPFASRQLVPDGLLPSGRPYSAVVEALHFHDEQLGFVVFEVGTRDGRVYDLLSEQISSALKSTLLLVKNVQLYHQALEAQQEAEEADRLKSRFLSMVSHELRTPLSLLVGLSQMMLREQEAGSALLLEPYRQDLARIHVSAQQLDGLIRDVLDLARSQVGQLRLVRKPVELERVLREVALVGEQMAREKGLRWQVAIPAGMPWVWGDATRLRQVVFNLVSNAVKFTPQGEVRLAAEMGEGHVTILVSDTGLGVPLAEQEAIFDEFRQSDRTRARGYSGLGLGLALCRRLVELHGGSIGVRSSGAEDAGSTFYFTLPTICGDTSQGPGAQNRLEKVLLLTRRATSVAPLIECLERQGFWVEVVNVAETQDWLAQALASPPGAVVLDFLPASDQSWELMEALKHNPVTESIPVLFCSLLQDEDSGLMLSLDYLAAPLRSATAGRALQRQGAASDDPIRKAILVVDDEPGVLDMHARIVQEGLPGCRVLRATSGREALALMQQRRPDLVLLDLMMPEVDGFDVLESMRGGETTRDTPVLVLTGRTLTEKEMGRLGCGVTAVLQKGVFTVAETLGHIAEALAHKRGLGSEMRGTVRKVMAYIHEHYAEPVSRAEMAAYANLSERHLNRCFRLETGVTPLTYLNRYRIDQAKVLLEKGDKSIAEVALATGFSDSSYLARVFRREVGLSPAAYRRGERPPCAG
jgi:signal transduction histidine kinase/DNA-binding LacI/PurR family transcriptional regulator/AraC-like DNA-binding protein/ActR/RegA family two-component response regulator